METGHDLIFFWVARMVMLGTELTGKSPFAQVLFHPMVCDYIGRKMSKSVGNVVDPKQVIAGSSVQQRKDAISEMCLSESEFKLAMMRVGRQDKPPMGADALRMSLCLHSLNKDTVNYSLDDCEKERKFLNKLWNSCFALSMFTSDLTKIKDIVQSEDYEQKLVENLQPLDKWINYKLLNMIKECNKNIENHQYSVYLSKLQHFWKNDFCDWYLEACKGRLRREVVGKDCTFFVDDHKMAAVQWNIANVTEKFLRLLHPVAPFVTEELWQRLPGDIISTSYPNNKKPESIMIAPYPSANDLQCQLYHIDVKDSKKIDDLMKCINGYRRVNTKVEVKLQHIAFHVKCNKEYSNFKNQFDMIKVFLPTHLRDFKLLGPNSNSNEVESNHMRSTIDESLTFYWQPHDIKKYIHNEQIDKTLLNRLKKLPDNEKHEVEMIEEILDQRLKFLNQSKNPENFENI